MNTNEKEIDPKSIDNESKEIQAQMEESNAVCKNGVCELNWHPKRPQAA